MRKLHLLLVLVLFSGCLQEQPSLTTTSTARVSVTTITVYVTTSTIQTSTTTLPVPAPSEISIASWNLQRFGPTKAGNNELMLDYRALMEDYNIVIVQEITDASGDAFRKLCTMMPRYTCIISQRLGTSTYKEQYGVLYRDIKLDSTKEWAPVTGYANFARPPYSLRFSTGNWSFQLTTIHTDPDHVKRELSALEKLLESDDWTGDEIVIGDLNADCDYYRFRNDFTDWTWVIPDNEDTTAGPSNCAYDRIILNQPAENNYVSYGVMRDVQEGQSDHYLVYGTFSTAVS